MLTTTQQFLKRTFDLLLSVVALVPALFLILLLGIIASISVQQWGWFQQIRIGRHGRPFHLYKIRTLKGMDHEDVHSMEQSVTPFGKWLRTTKLDEIPQVLNVLLGDMSWVGPRPDVPGYADQLKGEDRAILLLRPGLTGPATLKYKNEEALLLQQDNPNRYNDEVIWPDKVRINKAYMKDWSLAKDVGYLWKSFVPSR